MIKYNRRTNPPRWVVHGNKEQHRLFRQLVEFIPVYSYELVHPNIMIVVAELDFVGELTAAANISGCDLDILGIFLDGDKQLMLQIEFTRRHEKCERNHDEDTGTIRFCRP
jgi:hypothetical protein